MKSGIPAFIAATILLLITMTGKVNKPEIPRGDFDSDIKLSSLANIAPLVNSQPILPVAGIASPRTIKNTNQDPESGNLNIADAPSINAAAITVSIADNNENIFAYHENIRRPLASLTKIMTAIAALENIGAQKLVTITADDILPDGDAGGFKPGETFSVQDLIISMFTVSSNDAASALARFYGTKDFIDAMQRKAAELGMSDTTFFDPTGLTTLNQSTATDLQKLIAYALAKYPQIFNISRQKENAIVDTRSGIKRILKNINTFAGLPYFLGGKTGYTDEAHGNLVSLFDIRGNKILIIVLGTDDRFGETEKLYNWAKLMLK